MIGRVLVALDRSERAPQVLETAKAIAEKFSAAVYLLRVIDVPPEIPPAAATSGDQLEPSLVREALDELGALAGAADIHATLHVVADPWPPRAIVGAAEKLDVDLIVVGSHGYKGWDRLLGTNAAAIANRARRHVLVVHSRSPT